MQSMSKRPILAGSANRRISDDIDGMFLSVPGGQPYSPHWDAGFPSMAEGLFAGVDENILVSATDEGGEEMEAEEDSEAPLDIGACRQKMRVVKKEPVWKKHTSGRFQGRCFSVKWRDSHVNKDEFVAGLFGLAGQTGSFVLGTEVGKYHSNYLAVVRLRNQARWTDWRKVLNFGHGEMAGEAGVFVEVLVPQHVNDDGITSFVHEMKLRCERYSDISFYQEDEMMRVQDKTYLRPGRRTRVGGT